MRFVEEGFGQGHEEKYYQTMDQRFLGDETFVERVATRAKERDIQPSGPRVRFNRLLEVVAEEYRVSKGVLIGSGRQRNWIEARQMLVYLAREWGKLTTQELGRRLNRDPSMMSRLHRNHEDKRDRPRERKLAKVLSQ
jgi:chromosomal replication initiation ATPase DnaA